MITGIVLALAAPTGYMPFDPLDTVIIGLIYGGLIGLTIGFLSSLIFWAIHTISSRETS